MYAVVSVWNLSPTAATATVRASTDIGHKETFLQIFAKRSEKPV